MALVLLYNYSAAPDSSKLRIAALKLGVRVRDVDPADFGKTVGELCGNTAVSAETSLPAASFSEPMLVMHDFRPGQVDSFLTALRAARIRPITLKAVVTETNAQWSSQHLHDELLKEHAAIKAIGKGIHKK